MLVGTPKFLITMILEIGGGLKVKSGGKLKGVFQLN